MKKFALVAAGLALSITPALADNTDQKTVTVSGTIVASLDATVDNNLTMPHLVKPASGEGTTGVTVACGSTNGTNTVTYTGGGNPFAAGNSANTTVQASSSNEGALATTASTGICATVTVSGDTNYFFGVATAVVTSPTDMTLSSPVCYDGAVVIPTAVGATGVQLSGGTKVLKCGATISANNDSAASYSGTGSFTVTVTYD